MLYYLFKSYKPKRLQNRRGHLKLVKELAVPLTGDPKLNDFFSKPLYYSSKTLQKNFILTRGTKNKMLTSTTELTIQARHLEGNSYEYDLTARREQSEVRQTFKTVGPWNFLGVPAEAAKRPSIVERLVIHNPTYPFTLVSSDTKYAMADSNFLYYISNSLGLLHLDDEERVKKTISRFCQSEADPETRLRACKAFSGRIDAEVQSMLYFTRYKLNNPGKVTARENTLIDARWRFFRATVLDSLIAACESSKLSSREQKALATLKKNLAAIAAGATSKEQIVGSYQQGDIIPIFAVFERALPGWNPELPWRYSSADLAGGAETTGNSVLGFFWSYDEVYTNIHSCILNSILVNRNSPLISFALTGKKCDRLTNMHSGSRCVISHKGVNLKIEGGAVHWKPSSFSDSHYKKVEAEIKPDYCLVKRDGFVFSTGYDKKATIIKITEFENHPRVFVCSFGISAISHLPSQPGECFLYSESSSQIGSAKFNFTSSETGPIHASASPLIASLDLKLFLAKIAESSEERTLITGYSVSLAGGILMTQISSSSVLLDFVSTEGSSQGYQRSIIVDVTAAGEWKVLDTHKHLEQNSGSRSYFLATHIRHKHSVYSLVFRRRSGSKQDITYSLFEARADKLVPVVVSRKVSNPKLLAALTSINCGSQNASYWDEKAERLIISENIKDQEAQKSPILAVPVKIFSIGF